MSGDVHQCDRATGKDQPHRSIGIDRDRSGELGKRSGIGKLDREDAGLEVVTSRVQPHLPYRPLSRRGII